MGSGGNGERNQGASFYFLTVRALYFSKLWMMKWIEVWYLINFYQLVSSCRFFDPGFSPKIKALYSQSNYFSSLERYQALPF